VTEFVHVGPSAATCYVSWCLGVSVGAKVKGVDRPETGALSPPRFLHANNITACLLQGHLG